MGDGPNNCDVAIVELSSEADVQPVPVYQWDDEVGKHMEIYGWGVTGSAATIKSKDCDDGDEDKNGCTYGATDQYCRLSRHYSWIHSVIGDTPVPAPTPKPTPAPTPTPTPLP